MVYAANFWLNAFPMKDSISCILGPCALITGQNLTLNQHCQLKFGKYVQTHEDHDSSMQSRTIGALALWPTGNIQGRYFFFSLTTDLILNHNHWTQLPMPNEVINHMHHMARQEQADWIRLLFQDCDQHEIINLKYDDDNDIYHDEDDEQDNDNDNNNHGEAMPPFTAPAEEDIPNPLAAHLGHQPQPTYWQ